MCWYVSRVELFRSLSIDVHRRARFGRLTVFIIESQNSKIGVALLFLSRIPTLHGSGLSLQFLRFGTQTRIPEMTCLGKKYAIMLFFCFFCSPLRWARRCLAFKRGYHSLLPMHSNFHH